MKKVNIIAVSMALAVALYSCSASRQVQGSASVADQQVTVNYQTFYDDLSPYGSWIDYPGYGYVWSPSIADFQPYGTNGYWVSTTAGWSWNSGYNWGWAPFHYGRWFYETGYGWLWVPGYEWAPAWVAWRNSPDFYGWAPLAPGMQIGVSVGIPYEHWTFVDHHYLNDRNLTTHIIDNSRKEVIYNNTTVINNINYTSNKTVYAKGPDVQEVQKYTGHKIAPLTIHPHAQAAPATINDDKKEMKVYKPDIRQSNTREQLKPRQVIQYKDIPHDNGKRGTWAIPEQHPSQRIMQRGGANDRRAH